MVAMDDDYPILGQLVIISPVEDESTSLKVPRNTSSTASMPPRADQRYPVTLQVPIGFRLLMTAVDLVTLYLS